MARPSDKYRKGAHAQAVILGDRGHGDLLARMSDEALGTLLRSLQTDMDAHRTTVWNPASDKRERVHKEIHKLFTGAKLEWWTRFRAPPDMLGSKCTRGDIHQLRGGTPKTHVLKRYDYSPVDQTVTHNEKPAPQRASWPAPAPPAKPVTLAQLQEEYFAVVDSLARAEARGDELHARELEDELQIRAIIL